MAKFYIVYASSHLLNFDPFLKEEEHVPAYVYDLCLLSLYIFAYLGVQEVKDSFKTHAPDGEDPEQQT
ncbi:hypothetical protein OUZ56_000693 [Daphnia magna]|uniref:Uncharacterized protein n=1 Tax=Daphnia magna TaxID=35525 RepID=A0ABR0A0G4_9CRUS|nr:hypothetical protein OUZ56_000693 [Daphnia magna]